MKHLLLVFVVLTSSGCWTAPQARLEFADKALGPIQGLSACLPEQAGPLAIDPRKPLTLLVHGCNFSRGNFRKLSAIFEAHGQQTVCFNYNDRDAIDTAAAEMSAALTKLEGYMGDGEITILGHSQGGLVARRTLAKWIQPEADASTTSYRLVTVSSPFAGVQAASHCGILPLHFASLGISVGICQVVTGSDWSELFPGSEFVNEPGKLAPRVTGHLRIATREWGSCRKPGEDGSCAESDYVFSLEEQIQEVVDRDPRVRVAELTAGHAAVVGEQGRAPRELMRLLQKEQILAQTPKHLEQPLASLMRRLY